MRDRVNPPRAQNTLGVSIPRVHIYLAGVLTTVPYSASSSTSTLAPKDNDGCLSRVQRTHKIDSKYHQPWWPVPISHPQNGNRLKAFFQAGVVDSKRTRGSIRARSEVFLDI